jgi:hypothetical protein
MRRGSKGRAQRQDWQDELKSLTELHYLSMLVGTESRRECWICAETCCDFTVHKATEAQKWSGRYWIVAGGFLLRYLREMPCRDPIMLYYLLEMPGPNSQ